jgi:tetratricopeptide (TPR) repeat protein
MTRREVIPALPRDRTDAAVLLRAIRAAPPAEAEPLIDAACSALPGDRFVRRVRIASLLRHRHFDEADALLARGLLDRPHDASLLTLRALSLLEQRQPERAGTVLRAVLARRPHHVRTMRLAARIARRLGRHDEAVRHLERAASLRPHDETVTIDLVDALLRTGSAERASDALARLDDPGAVLRARVLAACGRDLDARLILESALRESPEPAERSELLTALIDHAERTGSAARIRRIAAEVERATPSRVRTRAAAALISIGDFREALDLAEARLEEDGDDRCALGIVVVAAAQAGLMARSIEALERMNAAATEVDRRRMFGLWRRGWRGRVIRDQNRAETAATEPTSSHLEALVTRAAETFEDTLSRDDGALGAAGRLELTRHRATCRRVLATHTRVR